MCDKKNIFYCLIEAKYIFLLDKRFKLHHDFCQKNTEKINIL